MAVARRLVGYKACASPLLLGSVLLALLVILPLLTVALSWQVGWTENMAQLWQSVVPRYLYNSVMLVTGVMLFSALLGIPCAWFITHYRFPGCSLFSWALLLPIAIPPYIAAYSYGGLLEYAGPLQTMLRDWLVGSEATWQLPPIRSLGGAICVIGFILTPYVYVLSRTAFMAQGRELYDSARLLGISKRAMLWRVAIPAARPAIVAAMALVAMETLADYGAVYFLAVDTLTTGIYRTWFGRYDPVSAMQLASMLIGIVLLVLVAEKLARGAARYDSSHRVDVKPEKLDGLRGYMIAGFCMLPLLGGFVIPTTTLLWMTQRSSLSLVDDLQVWEAIGNSLQLALMAAMLLLACGLLLATAQKRFARGSVPLLGKLATVGYAMPGAVIAVGLLAPLTQGQQWLFGWFTGEEGGLLLTGTAVALLYAYAVRFMALTVHPLQAGLERISPQMEWSAHMLGAGRWRVFRQIQLPLLSPSMAAAALLVFVEVVKELPATLILRPFNYDTLAIRAYSLASDERLMDASLYGLVILLIGLLPVWLLHYTFRHLHESRLMEAIPRS